MKRRVCLFGLSANPPTGEGGHVGIVRELSQMKMKMMKNHNDNDDATATETDNTNNVEEERFHEIRILPVYSHMFNEKRGRGMQASYEARLEMCRLAFREIPKVIVSNDEEKCFEWYANKIGMTKEEDRKNIRVGTADLLDMLMDDTSTNSNTSDSSDSDSTQAEYSFALGADTFMDLSKLKWRRAADIFQLLNGRLVVFHRKEENENENENVVNKMITSDSKYDLECRDSYLDLTELSQSCSTNKDLDQRIDEIAQSLHTKCPNLKENIILLNVPSLTSVSSSRVRNSVGVDDEFLEMSLSPDVLDYVKKNRLYSFAE
uniref:Nicotinamide-nucleotide adenylyltransferase n=1 Tax=Chaetoceros debilis TaxID=122233 RepID=A0A7S3Q9Q3_9STRA